MANFITLIRIFIAFIAVYFLFGCNLTAYAVALTLTLVAFAFDGLDGYVARKFNESSKLGAMLDIMSDRIVENTFWITFAVFGWLPIVFPLVVITRGFITDGIRSIAAEQGFTAFGGSSMQDSKLGNFICCSKFSRLTYGIAKLVAFLFIIVAHAPGLNFKWAQPALVIANTSAVIAIEFCVIRALPVVFESKKLFAKKELEKQECKACNE